MTDKQPEALRLADEHDNDDYVASTRQWREEAAVQLRELHLLAKEGWRCAHELDQERNRLHELNAELVEALRRCAASLNPNHEHTAFVFAALAKAEEK